MSTIIWIVILIVALAAGIGAGYFIGYNNRKKTAEAQIGSAEAEATRLVNEAIKTAEQKRKEAVLEAKDEAFKLKAEVDAQKAEADKEIKQRRAEISRQENRIDQKETALDRKTEALERKEEELKKRSAEAEERLAEIDALRAKEMERLETLAGLSQEDAREVLLHKVDEELTHEKAVRVAAYETDLKENCDNIARNLIGQAVSRCAADHCSETTVSVVPLPSDEMKGRIIGREGRNIRALETATGVDLIIDDTPEAITLSSFDQTRREVARMTLERLIGDGRIHPARIEETVEKCRHDLELQMKREGERAVMELGIHGLHPDLIKLIGRLKYRTSFGQNALTHSMEVAWVAGLLAGEMGVNVTMARRAGLLHDIGKALDHEIEGSHVQIGVDICRKYKENTQIIHAIEAHHGDVEPKTPLAFIIQACDAISAARPGARRENVESYVKRLENLEEISSSFEGVEQASTAGHSDVDAHLSCQQAGHPGHLHAVGQGVLAKAGAVLQAADELDEVGVQAVDAKLHHGTLALPLHLQLKVVAALLHRLLNAGGVDAAITDQALQRHAGNLAAGLVKGGQGDGLRGIIDDKIHAGGSFQRADVAALTADDPALHLVAGQGHHADGGLAAVVSGAAADGLTDHVAGDVIAVFLQVSLVGSHTDSLLVGELLVHLVQQHFAGIFLAQARQGLQALHLLGTDGIHLSQTAVGLLVLFLELFFLLFQGFGLAVQRIFLLVNAVLLAADLSTALLDLLVGLCLLGIDLGFQTESLVLGFQNSFFSFLVSGLDRFVHQAGSLGFRAADLCLGGLFTVVVTNKITRAGSNSSNHDHDQQNDRGHRVHSPYN